MNADMYTNPVTQENLDLLKRRGFFVVGPDHGRLASGRVGVGRLVPVDRIVQAARMVLGREGSLAGLKVLVTAGGTREPLDPVRHLGNRSSGRMGYASATAARDRGAQVTLVSAATGLPAPYGVELRQVVTAEEMCEAVVREAAEADILLMAAAVADYRPVQVRASKMKKTPKDLVLALARTPDVLENVAVQREKLGKPELVVGFAAETEDLIANARLKLAGKGLDLVVANDVSDDDSGFAVDTNRVVLVAPDGTADEWPLMDKTEVAERLLGRVARMWGERHGQGDE
jgi:phosphopantothenoylcysteine decarboxylase/phosphopantothenate--cysteine ligase